MRYVALFIAMACVSPPRVFAPQSGDFRAEIAKLVAPIGSLSLAACPPWFPVGCALL